jgi:hypothetical protein
MDKWMATDFVAIRHLLGARDDVSTWLCGASIREAGKFLLGDPGCDRIVFDPPLFETVCPVTPTKLCAKYLIKVNEVSSKLSTGDVLVLVLVGHGSETTGSFIVGDPGEGTHRELEKEALEECVSGTKGEVVLISSACFSGGWESPHWSLITAAGANQHAVSIVESGSGKCRRGFFTNSLIAEHCHEFQIRAPCTASLDDNGNCGQQQVHDFGPDKAAIRSCILPKLSLQGVCNWIHQWTDHVGRAYKSPDITFIPCTNNKPHSLPFLPLTSPMANLHRLPCVPPLPAADHATSASTRLQLQIPAINQPTTLSTSDRDELLTRAADLLRFRPINTAKETPTILRCWRVIHGDNHGKSLDDVAKSKLLVQLRNRAHCQELGLKVAKSLGWTKAVEELGGAKGEQSPMFSLQNEAEESGCLVKMLIVYESKYQTWISVASWLARVWEASGRPIVARGDWDSAIEQSLL